MSGRHGVKVMSGALQSGHFGCSCVPIHATTHCSHMAWPQLLQSTGKHNVSRQMAHANVSGRVSNFRFFDIAFQFLQHWKMTQHPAIYFYSGKETVEGHRYFEFCRALNTKEEFPQEYLKNCLTIFPTEDDEDAGQDFSMLYESEDLALRIHGAAVLFLQKFGLRIANPATGEFEELTDANYDKLLSMLEKPFGDKFLQHLLRSLCAVGFTHYVKSIYNAFACAYQRTKKFTAAAREFSKHLCGDLARAIIAFHDAKAPLQLSRLSAIITQPGELHAMSFKHPRKPLEITVCKHGTLPRLKSAAEDGTRAYKCLLHIVVTETGAPCDMNVSF